MRYFLSFLLFVLAVSLSVKAQKADTLWLQKSRPEGLFKFNFSGEAQKFHALVGLNDASGKKNSTVLFSVIADNKEIFRSPVMRHGSKAIKVDLNLEGVKNLVLIIEDSGNEFFNDLADFTDAYILYKGAPPVVFNYSYINKSNILTPAESPKPRINGAKVFGVRPGNPFLFTITATGKRPMSFDAEDLPRGLSLDTKTGIITGVLKDKGESLVTFKAINSLGIASRKLKIIVGDKIALTPPLGWNGYNRYGDSINQNNYKASVEALIKSGIINHGWTYINIDDSWSVRPGSNDPKLMGEPRDSNGMIKSNKKFPDMKGLTDFIHSKGLKAGLYSSPGRLTCSRYTASYQFEDKDVLQWAKWGFDYIKYDWCTYKDIAKDQSIEEYQKPYLVMRKALDKVDRDIVFSMSQYGMGNSWEWGEKIGGNSWRTTGDLIDTWESVSDVGFNQAGKEKFAGPGHWNDPDMLVVGFVGWGHCQYPSRLTADEQYTHISLWSLLASPLLIGCDLIHIDDFTKSLLTNDEVIDINQDPLGKQASRVSQEGGLEIWAKELEDGSKAVGLFNRNSSAQSINATWNSLAINGNKIVRDVWRQKDQGVFSDSFSAVVPAHGVKLITIRKTK